MATTDQQLDRILDELIDGKQALNRLSLPGRIDLAKGCLRGIGRVAEAWVDAACRAKGIPHNNAAVAEEISAGPMATARYLRLTIRALQDIVSCGHPRLPGEGRDGPGCRLQVPIFPTRAGLYDKVLFGGFRAHVWMESGVTRENFSHCLATDFKRHLGASRICLVLGAGNVSSIAATDVLGKLFQEGCVVLLKMNPVNEYLGPLFEEAFAPLVERGFLRCIYGGPSVGARAVIHDRVEEVHITGSAHTLDAIVWGDSPDERKRRKMQQDPSLTKPVTCELGNVTPWVVVPGPYTRRELDFQAENLAAMITNNASFNCVAVKMIVTHAGWDQRDEFLDRVESKLTATPRRSAYYPGAAERFRRFAGREPDREDQLPWTLIRDVNRDDQEHLFREESFVGVTGETSLEAPTTEAFLDRAAEFANEQCWGTLGIGVMVHPKFRRQPGGEARFQRFVSHLQYGTVAINHWPGLAFAVMNSPWGGFPGRSLDDPQSGIGWVHNVYLLNRAEKTVFEGPLVVWPKPLWFPSHRRAAPLAWRVFRLYCRPAWWKLPGIFYQAVRGSFSVTG